MTDRSMHRMLVVATALLALLHLWMSSHVPDPTVVFDENGYLGTARWMAGGTTWEMPFSPFYSVGYSLLLAPPFAVLDDPASQWIAVRVVNALLLASLLPSLTALLHRVLGVPRLRAMVAAGLGALVPAVVAAGVSAIAENLVLALVPLTVLAAWATVDDAARWRHRVLLGLAVGALHAAHPRFTLAAPIVLVALVVGAARDRLDRRVAIPNAVSLVLVLVVVRSISAAVRGARWDAVERLQGSPADWWELATSPNGIRELALTALGQGWYLLAGSAGLALVGVVVLVRGALAPTPPGTGADRDPTPGTERAIDPDAWRRRVVIGATFAVAAAVFATSVLFFAQNQFRADHYVYGRHNDSFTPVWVAVAMAFVLDRRRRPTAVLGLALGATMLSGLAVARLRDPMDRFGEFSAFAVPGIIRFVGGDPAGTFVRATVVAGAATAVIIVLTHLVRRGEARPTTRGGPTWAASVVLAGAVASASVWAGYGTVSGTQTFHALVHERSTLTDTLERLGIDEVCVDASAVRARANLTVGWELPATGVRSYDSAAGEQPSCDVAVALLDDVARRGAGDRVVALDQRFLFSEWGAPNGLAAWVREGPERERLEQRGALAPAGFPAPLPARARDVAIEILDGEPVVQVEAGRRASVRASVEHVGTGSPWPDSGSFGLDGHVRVVALVTPQAADGVLGARSGGELGTWVLPGDEVEVDLAVVAVGQFLEPLPPGRYDVQLAIAQTGYDWVASGGTSATFVLEVVDEG